MDSSDKFWLLVWIAPSIALVVIIVSIAYYNVRYLELGYPLSVGQQTIVSPRK